MQLVLATVMATLRSNMRKLLALTWIVLGIGLAVSTVNDLGAPYWKISWLAIGAVGTLLAWTCSAILFFGHGGRSLAGVAIASMFVFYCVYLFLISPPEEINVYALLSSAVILLGVATIVTLAREATKSSKAAM